MAELADVVVGASCVHDLVRRLGAWCLDSRDRIERERDRAPAAKALVEHVWAAVRDVPAHHWWPVRAGTGSLAPVLTDQVVESLGRLAPTPALQTLALLGGLCIAVMEPWYTRQTGVVTLERGDVLPYPRRPVNAVFDDYTPHATTTGFRDPLTDVGFLIYDGALGPVHVSFAARDLLDEACWQRRPAGLPVVAAVFPYPDGAALQVPPEIVTEDWWFGTGPTEGAWQPDAIVAMLSAARQDTRGERHCAVAVLPELSVLDADELASLVRQHWASLPDVVVMGSAHVTRAGEDGEVRANETRVFARGVELFRHRKRHPFRTRQFTPDRERPLPEGLTPVTGISMAAGSTTTLAVLICADAFEIELVAALARLGVNLLLVPAMSPHEAAFHAAATVVASMCQGLCVVANGTPPGRHDQPPFKVLVSAPHRGMPVRSDAGPPGPGSAVVALFDPNVPVGDALSWLKPPSP